MDIEENIVKYHDTLLDRIGETKEYIDNIKESAELLDVKARTQDIYNYIIIGNNKLIELEHQFRKTGMPINEMYTESKKDTVPKIAEYKVRKLMEENKQRLSGLEEKLIPLTMLYVTGENSKKNRKEYPLNEDIVEGEIEDVLNKYKSTNMQISKFDIEKDIVDSVVEYVNEKEYTMEEAAVLTEKVVSDLNKIGIRNKANELKEGLRNIYIVEVLENKKEPKESIENEER